MTAPEQVKQWATTKFAGAPADALRFMEWFAQQNGAGVAIQLQGLAIYCFVALGLSPGDDEPEKYLPSEADSLWFAARGIPYVGKLRPDEDDDDWDDTDMGCFTEDLEPEEDCLENGGLVGVEDRSDVTLVGERTVNGKVITSCWHNCPFYKSGHDNHDEAMSCGHPFFKNKDFFEAQIISWKYDIQEGFPPACPLWK